MDDIDSIIRKYTLINAQEHEGKAQPKSVLGRILADRPDLREKVMELRSKTEFATIEINKISFEAQKEELEKLGGYEPLKRIEKKRLPDIDRRDKFIVRFAPNPDGAIHLGNARPAILSDEYVKKYKGKLILRFDDTDPKIKIPEKKFYSWIKEDLKWLKVRYSSEIIASKRLNIYYKYAEELIKSDKAYVCTCKDEWKRFVKKSEPCKCRPIDPKMQLKRWKQMLLHKYKEGEAVLRIKTDLIHKNPAVRDWPAVRIVDKPNHPLQKSKHVWPLYNFASAIDDHLTNITNIFRGQEHATNETKQKFLYDHFKWKYPSVTILGRLSLSDNVLSKSEIREGIKHKKFTGWEDARLGTIRALRRRGFQPDAIRQIIVDIGPKPSDITISMENLSAYNRKIIDRPANRYFFVEDPIKITIKGLKMKKTRIPLHPDEDRGYREFPLSSVFYIEKNDFNALKGVEVRLKNLCNVILDEKSVCTNSEPTALPRIHWVPEKHITVRVSHPNKDINGYGEPSLRNVKNGDIIQFERFGYVRVEKKSNTAISTVFTHD